MAETDVGGLLPKAIEQRRGEITQRREKLGPEFDLGFERLKDISRRTLELEKRREAGMAEPTLGIMKEFVEPVPPVPQMPELANPPDEPLFDPEKFRSYFGMMFIMSMLLPKAAGGDMLDGLNALNQGTQGWMQGRQDLARHELGRWQTKTRSALDKYRMKLDHYRGIIENRSLNLEQKFKQYKVAAQTYGDQRAALAAERGDVKDILELHGNEEERLNKMEEANLRMEERLENQQTLRTIAGIRAGSYDLRTEEMAARPSAQEKTKATVQRAKNVALSQKDLAPYRKTLEAGKTQRARIEELEKLIAANRTAVGAGGTVKRFTEGVGGQIQDLTKLPVGPKGGQVPANEIAARMHALQGSLRKEILGPGNPSNFEWKKMEQVAQGLKLTDSADVSLKSLANLRSYLDELRALQLNEIRTRAPKYVGREDYDADLASGILKRGDLFIGADGKIKTVD